MSTITDELEPMLEVAGSRDEDEDFLLEFLEQSHSFEMIGRYVVNRRRGLKPEEAFIEAEAYCILMKI